MNFSLKEESKSKSNERKLSDPPINKSQKKNASTKAQDSKSFRVTFGRTETVNVKKKETKDVYKIPPSHAYSIMNIPHKKKVDVPKNIATHDILTGEDIRYNSHHQQLIQKKKDSTDRKAENSPTDNELSD